APVATALVVAVEVAARGGDLHGVFAPGAMVGLGVDLALGAVAFNDEQRIADAVHGDLVVGAVLRHQVHEPLRGPVVYTSAILHGTLVVDALQQGQVAAIDGAAIGEVEFQQGLLVGEEGGIGGGGETHGGVLSGSCRYGFVGEDHTHFAAARQAPAGPYLLIWDFHPLPWCHDFLANENP